MNPTRTAASSMTDRRLSSAPCRWIVPTVLVLLVTTAGAWADTVMIDDFSVPASGNAHTSKGQVEWYDTTATVVGGIRDGSAGCEASEADGLTTAQITDGEFTVFTNKRGSPSVYLSYDQTSGWGPDRDTAPFNGVLNPVVDLTDGGENDRFSLVFTYAEGRNVSIPYFNDFLITIKIAGDATLHWCNIGSQGTGAANTWMEAHYNDLNAGTPAEITILFSELSGTVDMANVEGIALHICSQNYDFEYNVDSFSTVPEPATVALLALGSAALLVRRRRRIA